MHRFSAFSMKHATREREAEDRRLPSNTKKALPKECLVPHAATQIPPQAAGLRTGFGARYRRVEGARESVLFKEGLMAFVRRASSNEG